MSNGPVKVCVSCKKDVANAKRVKDPQGRYYCAPCHEALTKKKAEATAPVAAGGGDEYDFSEPMPTPKPKPVVKAPLGEGEAKKAVPLPAVCPNCGARVLPNRRLCIKCNRDVTKMDKVIAMKAEEAAGPSKEEKIATVVAFLMKIGLVVGCVAVVAFVLYGMYLRVKPVDTFEDFPTSREQVVRDFLKHIDEGSDKSLEKAYLLISFRERATNAPEADELRYKEQFKKMREDFVGKYGADWLSKMELVNAGPMDSYADDEVDFKLKLGADEYMVATQVQMGVDIASVNMMRATKVKKEYPEDGKNHFAVLDVSGYKIHTKRTMDERLGITARQRPEF